MTASTATITKASYNPMYCLSEHLDYFNESVAGKHELLKVDFDEIFARSEATPVPMTSLVSVSSAPIVVKKPNLVPPSPKSVMSTIPEQTVAIQPKTVIDREQAVVSPTTVTSTVVFSEEAPRIPAVKPKTKSRKRKMTQEPAEETITASVDPNDKEDVRRERNRQHAKRSRQRKRDNMQSLAQAVETLKEENSKLFQILGLAPEADHAVVAEREETMQVAANERFVEALMQPQNRVLSDDAIGSLRELFATS